MDVIMIPREIQMDGSLRLLNMIIREKEKMQRKMIYKIMILLIGSHKEMKKHKKLNSLNRKLNSLTMLIMLKLYINISLPMILF